MSIGAGFHRRTWSFVLLAMLAACSVAEQPAPPTAQPSAEANHDVVEQIGDVTVHCSVVQTSMLPDAIARQYGVERSPETLLLLVAVRKGDAAVATALPATVDAVVTDLRGGKQTIDMRQMQSGEFVDSIGTLHTTLPETLHFDLTVRAVGVAPVHIQFQRDLYPQ
jgi:hypothetical protein